MFKGAELKIKDVSGSRMQQSTSSEVQKSKTIRNLIIEAILSGPEKRLTLGQIFDWMRENAPAKCPPAAADKRTIAAWKNGIRHNLSLYRGTFKRMPIDARNSYWMVIESDEKPKGKAETQTPVGRSESLGMRRIVKRVQKNKKFGDIQNVYTRTIEVLLERYRVLAS